jgi:adenylate cyclase
MNQLLAELRRRSVFRVAAAYLVGGWLMLQIVGAIEASAGLPEWTDGMALVVLMIGLPIALVIAWAFELTPEGLKKTEDASDAVVEARGLSMFDFALLGGLVLVIAGIGAQALFLTPPDTRGPRIAVAEPGDAEVPVAQIEIQEGPAENSIAVLAFDDLSPDGDQEYFSDGMAEEILNVLVRVDGLAITSRTSAFQFKGQDTGIPEIAERLNVRHIVEGSVRKADDTIRITAQLIDTQTDAHLWSQTYDSPLTTSNVFEIQDEIATAIVAALSETLGVGAASGVDVEVETENLDAYDAYLQGQALFYERSESNFLPMIALFEQAVAADPGFARGWAALALSYSLMPDWLDAAEVDEAEAFAQALEAAGRASAIDDRLAAPYLARRIVATEQGQFARALEAVEQARAREPDSLQVTYHAGLLWLDLGYVDRGVEALENALEIDPNYQIARRHLARALIYQGETERGLDLLEESLLRGQESLTFDFISAYVALGDPIKAYLLNLSQVGDHSEYAFQVDPYHRWLTDETMSWSAYRNALIRSFENQYGVPPPFTIPERYEDSLLDPDRPSYMTSDEDAMWNPFVPDRQRPHLRDRFFAARKQLMRDLGLVAYWQTHGFPSQCRPLEGDDFECD